jgi:peptidyl-prolyl cis-trans isomerase D
LIKEATQRKISAHDPEVIAFIQGIPLFQRDGEFDRSLYNNVVKHAFNRDPRAFEEGIRGQVKIMKMFRAETMGLNIPDEMMRKEYARRNQKIQVNYVLIDPKDFSDKVELNENEIQEYYNSHREDFLEPDSMNVQFATFPLAKDLTPEEKKAIHEKASVLYKTAAAAPDFTVAAKAAGAQVNETGLISAEQPDFSMKWPLEVLQKIVTAKAGAILEPVETADSIQVLKIAEKKPAFIPEFNKAKDAVKAKIIDEKTLALAKEKAIETQKTIAVKTGSGVAFASAALELSLNAKKTPFFGLGDYIPEIGISDDFTTAAFTLNKEKPLSDTVLTTRGPVILAFEAIQPIDEKKFEEMKKEFSNSLLEEKRVETMNRVIKEIKEKAKLETYLDKTKKQHSR